MWGKIMIPIQKHDYMIYMDYIDITVHCPRKGVKLYHSLAFADCNDYWK